MLKTKDLLGLYHTSAEEICEILERTAHMKELLNQGKKSEKTLAGTALLTLFYENSTRTRTSFELAGKYLGAHEVNIAAASSSVQKGETLIDPGKTLDSLKVDFIAIRHPLAGAPKLHAENVKASVINAGDGMNEHPTQALLDMFTMREKFGKIKGLKVAILGDIKHSRVAKSNLFGLSKLGAEVYMYAPATLMPKEIEKLGAHVCRSMDEAIEGAHCVMGLRIQLERQKGGLFPSLSEYSKFYGVKDAMLERADKNVIVMHPGPVNRGIELTPSVIDGENSVICEQVTNGLATRMAVLSLVREYRENNL